MSTDRSTHEQDFSEVEEAERWAAAQREAELLSALKDCLDCLRDNPRSVLDRLRAAALQARLGHLQEALVHYEGVLRSYLVAGHLMTAIALCQRLVARYPDLPRLRDTLTALYARAPRSATKAPSPVTPVDDLDEDPTLSYLGKPQASEDSCADERTLPQVRRAMAKPAPSPLTSRTEAACYETAPSQEDDELVVLLTHPKPRRPKR